jgi:hypothetical protein
MLDPADNPVDLPLGASTTGGIVDPRQLENTFVLEETNIDSSYIIGPKPGVSQNEAVQYTC